MTQKLTFVNGAKAACGCRHEFSSGGGEYSDVAYVHLCALHAGGAPVLDDNWKARMLDGRAIERDAQGLGEHPNLPWLDEGMNPPKFFEALGLELAGVSAQDQLDVDAYDAMAGNYDAKEFNFAAWAPASPDGAGWCLVSIHDTEDGPVAWWLREQPYVAAARPVRRARERDDLTVEECREYLRSGWTRVRGRTEQALMLQLCDALEAGAAPAAVAGPTAVELQMLAAKHTRSVETPTGYVCDAVAAVKEALARWGAAPAQEAPAAPAVDEEAAFTKWFQGEQGKPYQGMWEFARAAWLARAAAPQAPAAPVAVPAQGDPAASGRYKLADDGAHQYLDGIEARYSIEREDGTTLAWVTGDQAAADELMRAIAAQAKEGGA